MIGWRAVAPIATMVVVAPVVATAVIVAAIVVTAVVAAIVVTAVVAAIAVIGARGLFYAVGHLRLKVLGGERRGTRNQRGDENKSHWAFHLGSP
jgi:hypothetical protein